MTNFELLKKINSHTPGVLAKILHTLTTLLKATSSRYYKFQLILKFEACTYCSCNSGLNHMNS